MPAGPSADRMEFLAYPQKDGALDPDKSLLVCPWVLYKAKGGKVGSDGKNITNVSGTIGIIRGFTAAATNLKSIGISAVEEDTDFAMSLRKILGGREDALVSTDDGGIDYLIKNNPEFTGKFDKIVLTQFAPDVKYLAFSKEFYTSNKDLCEKVWAALKDARGKYWDSLLAKYL
jgi:polar amino acid transport system substrate-binding protein